MASPWNWTNTAGSSPCGFGLAYPPGSIDAIEAAVARGDREEAIVVVLRDILAMTEDEVDVLWSSPPSRSGAIAV